MGRCVNHASTFTLGVNERGRYTDIQTQILLIYYAVQVGSNLESNDKASKYDH